jgi:hypothetical protein
MKRNLGNGLEVWWINTNKKKNEKGKVYAMKPLCTALSRENHGS